MKIQFIFPNFGCPIGVSMGISFISTALKQAGHQTSCIHINDYLGNSYDLERIRKDVESYGPDLIAFSFGTNHQVEAREMAAYLKKYVKTPIIFGGIHTTLNADDMIALDSVDMICVGEGDESIVELANAMEAGEDYSAINNIWVKKDGEVIKNKIRPLPNLSEEAMIDTEIWDFQRIADLRNGWVNVITGRGCPFRCSYCHNDGVVRLYSDELGCSWKELNYIRRRSVKNMIAELKLIKDKYNVKAFSFNDDCFTHNKKWVIEFVKAYKVEIGLPFVCNTHALYIDEEIAKALGDANCDMVRFGVESGSDEIRKKILGRTVSDDVITAALKAVRDAGIRNFTYNMMAIPSETREDMLSTLKLNSRLKPDGLRVSLAYPYPGTTLYSIGEEWEIIEDVEYHDYLEKSKFKQSDEDRLFIDKTRMVYWWHINKDLGNGGSKIYKDLLDTIETIPEDEWFKEDTQSILLGIDKAVSEMLSKIGITHYTAKFPHRPDISIMVRGKDFIKEELLDQH